MELKKQQKEEKLLLKNEKEIFLNFLGTTKFFMIQTSEYFQPEEYHYSLDSVILAHKVAAFYETYPTLEQLKILDLCAGCGVVGLEFFCHLKKITSIDFLEIQETYRPYFDKNVQLINPSATNFNFLQMNYDSIFKADFANRYDIILSNPPYFFKGEGILSPSDFKNRCRFFIDSNLEKLISAVIFSLTPGGNAYLLVRPGTHHGRNLEQEIHNLVGALGATKIVDNVRGTNVLRITKKFQ
jgi:tRNA1(Val) A37 N6-methylase TrmN6